MKFDRRQLMVYAVTDRAWTGKMSLCEQVELSLIHISLRELKKVRHRKEEERQAAIDAALVRNRDYGSRRAYLIGGGLASMAAAAYLLSLIHIYKNMVNKNGSLSDVV